MSDTPQTYIAPHTFLKGELRFDGPAVISGRVEGTIIAQNTLEVAADGLVEGDIQGVLVDIQGTVKGNITAARACRLGASARVAGELRAANLAIAEGACFIGQVYVGGTPTDETPECDEPPVSTATTDNRMESLAGESEEFTPAAMSIPAPPPADSVIAPPAPTVRVLTQTVQQTLHRAPRIIKAR